MQVGARNMQNFSLLRKTSEQRQSQFFSSEVLSATVKEWLLAAEYLLAGGNSEVVLCERGIKTFEDRHAKHTGPGRGRTREGAVASSSAG